MVDDEDFERISSMSWHLLKSNGGNRYAINSNGKTHILMHRLIVNAVDGEFVDHINHDGLDNRKANLRRCSKNENARNRKFQKHSSFFKGVTYASDSKRRKRWRAQIVVNTKHLTLGYYLTQEEAAAAYDKAATLYHASFAATNKALMGV